MRHMMSGLNQLVGAWFCVVMSVTLLLHSFRLSSEGAAGGVWLTLVSLTFFIAGVLAMGKNAGR